MAERFLTLYLPAYDQATSFLRVLDGTRYETLARMWREILSHVGKNTDKVDWSDPSAWIPKLLCGDSQDLAALIWRESKQSVNPRWSHDLWRFVEPRSLVEVNDGVCALTELGNRFARADDAAIRHIDELEGMYLVLSEVSDKGLSALKDLFGGFRDFCKSHTAWKSDETVRSALRYRLNNLRYRDLVVRNGHRYEITDAGFSYLMRHYQEGEGNRALDLSIHKLVSDNKTAAKEQLREFLQTMDPFQFEHLVARLYEAMGYDNVELTPYLQDQGVDIKADIVFGISSVHEVVQVKRQKGGIGQPIVSMLRGAMPLFDAIRGSIVTTGSFSKKAKEIAVVRNAPPISLIDGERLLDLLIEHDIGIRRREIRILEFDPESLSEF